MRKSDSSPFLLLSTLVFACLAVVLTACSSPASLPLPAAQATLPPTTPATAIPSATSLPLATATPIPTAAPTPDPGIPSGKPPQIQPADVLSPDNASQVVELGGWGTGYAFDLPTVRAGQVISGGEFLLTYEQFPTSEYPDANRTRFWELSTGRVRLEMLHPLGYERLFADPNGNYFATYRGICPNEMGTKCVLDIWYIPRDERVGALELNFLQTVVYSPDNRWVAMAGAQEVQIWDLATGEPVRTIHTSNVIDHLQFSNNGELLAGFTWMTERALVWKVETGKQLANLVSKPYGPVFFPSAMAFSPDDSQLAIGFNGLIDYWSVEDWSEGLAWQAHNVPITRVVFSPDGSLLASAAEDGGLALSDAVTGKVLTTLTGHTGYVKELAFTSDGKLLISTAEDGTLRFWGIPKD